METFLQILGVLCLIAIALLLVPVAWLAYKLWQIRQSLRRLLTPDRPFDARRVPPMRARLEPLKDPDWDDADEIETLATTLRAAGFAEIGAFEINELPEVRLLALVHPGNDAYAVVYEHPEAGASIELFSEYADGRMVSYSSSRYGEEMDMPEFKICNWLADADAGELLAAFLDARPRGERLSVAAGEFVERFEAAYAREMDWRMTRGGITEEEIVRITTKDGTQPDADVIARIRQKWRHAINAFYQERLQDAFLATAELSAQQWERVRERTLFIHDQLTWEQVTEIAAMGLGIDPEDQRDRAGSRWQETERLAAGFPPREAFRRINEQLPAGRRYQKLGETTEPIAADVYVTPDFAAAGD